MAKNKQNQGKPNGSQISGNEPVGSDIVPPMSQPDGTIVKGAKPAPAEPEQEADPMPSLAEAVEQTVRNHVPTDETAQSIESLTSEVPAETETATVAEEAALTEPQTQTASAPPTQAAVPLAAPAPAYMPVQTQATEPEFDFGDGIKMPRNEARRIIEYGSEAFARDQDFQARQKVLAEKEAALTKLGPLEQLSQLVDDWGPMAPVYFQQIGEKIQELKKDPAAGLAIQLADMRRQMAGIEAANKSHAKLIEEREKREQAQAYDNNVRQGVAWTSDYAKKTWGDRVPPTAIHAVVQEAIATGIHPHKILARYYGEPPATPAAASTGAQATGTSSVPVVPRVGPPTSAKAPRPPKLEAMTPQERKNKLHDDVALIVGKHQGVRRF